MYFYFCTQSIFTLHILAYCTSAWVQKCTLVYSIILRLNFNINTLKYQYFYFCVWFQKYSIIKDIILQHLDVWQDWLNLRRGCWDFLSICGRFLNWLRTKLLKLLLEQPMLHQANNIPLISSVSTPLFILISFLLTPHLWTEIISIMPLFYWLAFQFQRSDGSSARLSVLWPPIEFLL